MKKIGLLLCAAIAVCLLGCDNLGCKRRSQEGKADNTSAVTDSLPLPDMHNAQSALDVAGVYKGVLPTASSGGMEVVINLTDSTYSKDLKYLGEKSGKVFNSKGSFSWDKSGSIITLNGEDKPNQYFVEEGALRQLDIEGKKIDGNLADQYLLKKQ